MEIKCVHGDERKYQVVNIEILFHGKKVKSEQWLRLVPASRSLCYCMDWPGFGRLLSEEMGAHAQQVETCRM